MERSCIIPLGNKRSFICSICLMAFSCFCLSARHFLFFIVSSKLSILDQSAPIAVDNCVSLSALTVEIRIFNSLKCVSSLEKSKVDSPCSAINPLTIWFFSLKKSFHNKPKPSILSTKALSR